MSSTAKKVSLPIASAPINALFYGIFIGFTMICLVVDTGSAELKKEFYGTKNLAAPIWFTVFNLLMLVSGAWTNASNFVYAFTRGSPRARKVADIVQMFLFVGSVAFSVIVVRPSELAGNATFEHCVTLVIQVAQLITAWVAFSKQGHLSTSAGKGKSD